MFETLGAHLKLTSAEDKDMLAVSAADARAIQNALNT
jgi:hypothetical protein